MSDAPILLHLMRHGAPVTPGLMIGHDDAAVSAAGIADCTAQAAGLAFGAIITSDLCRAADCGHAIASGRRLTPTRDPRWRELNFGAWEGQHPKTLPAEAYTAFSEDPDANPPPGGERWRDLRARVDDALADIDQPTLIVAHAGSIRAALAILCGFDRRQIWAIDLPYASVVSIRRWRRPVAFAQMTRLVTCAG